MRNWYVDPKGGATVRPGTQFIGYPATAGFARLIPFQFSATIGQSYILVFSDGVLRFVKNPEPQHILIVLMPVLFKRMGLLTKSLQSIMLEDELRRLHYTQIADVMWLVCRGHLRKKLERHADDDWTIIDVAEEIGPPSPSITQITITPPPTGVSPVPETKTHYLYKVSSVDQDGVRDCHRHPS